VVEKSLQNLLGIHLVQAVVSPTDLVVIGVSEMEYVDNCRVKSSDVTYMLESGVQSNLDETLASLMCYLRFIGYVGVINPKLFYTVDGFVVVDINPR